MFTPRPLEPRWSWLSNEPAPRMLLEALKLYGVMERGGREDNPQIVEWAKEVGGDAGWYNKDSIPWCGLFMAVVAKRAGKTVPRLCLRAQAWKNFGRRSHTPSLGDVLVFWRGSPSSQSGHVGLYVGETEQFYYVLGGNQSDSVCITRIAKYRLIGAYAEYRIGKPTNVRPVYVGRDFGRVSRNEA